MKMVKIVTGIAVVGILAAFAVGCGKKQESPPTQQQLGAQAEALKKDAQAAAKTAQEKAAEAQTQAKDLAK